MSLGEYLDSDQAETVVMGCTCLGNPVDGNATANAEVTGLPIRELMNMVEPDEGVNTIVFVSADGDQVALPYAYVVQRRSALVFAVNGAPLAESVGGVNQLWLASRLPAILPVTSCRLGSRSARRLHLPPSAEARAALPEPSRYWRFVWWGSALIAGWPSSGGQEPGLRLSRP